MIEIERDASLGAYEISDSEGNELTVAVVGTKRVSVWRFLIPDTVLKEMGRLGLLNRFIPKDGG